ncbi:hypothetical protein EV651_114171 [Kribbella sp. VKM Ac-2571]|uniref:hypothetical protein n=1 Tax=Kribbella sp. VKM Ac-2571 TaxID=2512222 RepID=UPI00105B7C22|nr:hypothetical protein [Kribbella sp. VKM Ac-2571]TDO55475.1 hypothetical protein EV651_114171 [Kribbella sp. VKM Ac-2571]
MRKLSLIMATLMGVVGLAYGVGGPAQAAGTKDPFADQARTAGLSAAQARSLQNDVDREIAATGGRQVAANKVEWDGGGTVLPLPGEARVRDLTAAGDTYYRCPYLSLCTFTGKGYGGTMHYMSACREYAIPYIFASWINNQSSGLHAVFRDEDHRTIYTTPAPLSHSADSPYVGVYANFAKPCYN